jgi:DNA-binding NtrC family response regulator
MVANTKTVLITDDDKLILASFRHALERQGYKVLLAEEGASALAFLEKETVDIVFLDILMPGKDGLETLLEIKRRFPGVPVHVMSGGGTRSRHDFLTVAQKFGASSVIRKPVIPVDLIKIIEAIPDDVASKTTKTG